ncbi:hypothetical protein DFH28DRAFT_942277 [Melampsora americana]|nr:hypothetical protein DFH28DRAFT_942277 [Melampsora americana]
MSTQTSMKKSIHPIGFSFIILFSFIEFLISSILISNYNSNDSYFSDDIRDRLKFLLFTSIWSLSLTSLYLYGSFKLSSSIFFSLISHSIFLFISWIFWFSASISISHSLNGLSCGDLFLIDSRINVGIRYCDSLKAIEAFAWIQWITLTLVLGYIGWIGSKALKSGTGLKTPMREITPSSV